MKKIFIIILSACIVLILMASSVGFFIYQIKTPLSKNSYEQDITIEKGDSIKQIAQKLEEAQIIRGSFYFELYVFLSGKKNLQAGEYVFSPSLNITEIANALASGKIYRNDIKITIPEGFSIKQIDERLAQTGLIRSGDLINYKNSASSFLEGFLFPDTYLFSKKAAIEEIVQKMADNFDKKITQDMREETARQGKKFEDIINMASIVQQEAVSIEEMPKIAGVYYNRLNIGMPLQSDPTVNYATGKKLRQPTLEDIKIDSPYNTYKYRGLPPTPICNPGLDAIKSAIYPEKTDYLYFLHPINAPTVFSKTLEDHNANKAKWLK